MPSMAWSVDQPTGVSSHGVPSHRETRSVETSATAHATPTTAIGAGRRSPTDQA